MSPHRLLVGLLFSMLVVTVAGGCGGSSEEEVHRIPGSGLSLALPASWSAVNRESSAEELAEFQRDNPRFLGIADIVRASQNKFAAAEPPGNVRLLVSHGDAERGYTLDRHIKENLPALERDASGLDVRIHGPHAQIVELAGDEAWRIRWSYKGELGRVHLVQYTFVIDGRIYLLTYSTLRAWEESSKAFEASARSIEIGTASEDERPEPEGTIAFHREREGEKSDIYVMSAAGGEVRRLTRTGTDTYPAWSPDGELIAFTSTRDGNAEIYVMRADGSDQRRLTTAGGGDVTPSWSPDGTRIMYTRGNCDEDACDLHVMNADGSGVTRLTRNGKSFDGSWSPDGQRIVFWSERDFVSGVFVMNADGSAVRHLTPDFDSAWYPDWSPDGETILFVGSRDDPTTGDEETAIFRIDADGGEATKIASPTGYWIDEPEWSPDGGSIAFFSDGEGPGAIWVMKADGTQQRPLTRSGDAHFPSWQG